RAVAREGSALLTQWETAGVAVTVTSPEPLGRARNRALDEATLREQFGRLGNCAYTLAEIELEIEGAPFAPASLLNQIRREAVEQLQARQTGPAPGPVIDPAVALASVLPARHAAATIGKQQLHLLVRTPEQLEAALAVRPDSVTLDYLDLYGLRPSVERIQAAGI